MNIKSFVVVDCCVPIALFVCDRHGGFVSICHHHGGCLTCTRRFAQSPKDKLSHLVVFPSSPRGDKEGHDACLPEISAERLLLREMHDGQKTLSEDRASPGRSRSRVVSRIPGCTLIGVFL